MVTIGERFLIFYSIIADVRIVGLYGIEPWTFETTVPCVMFLCSNSNPISSESSSSSSSVSESDEEMYYYSSTLSYPIIFLIVDYLFSLPDC